MKTKLLLLSLVFTGLTYAQTVNKFYTQEDEDEETNYIYLTGTPDHSPSGPDSVWDFNLTQNGTNTTFFEEAGSRVRRNYPGTTELLESLYPNDDTDTVNYYKKDGDDLYITGTEYPNFTVNYEDEDEDNDEDDLYIGEFPLSYGSLQTDAIGGQLFAEGANSEPFFAGSATAEVDAYGTLNINANGLNALTASNVTRITVTQAINFLYEARPGTGDIINRYYYGADGTLLFKTTDGDIFIEGDASTDDIEEDVITRELSQSFALSNDSFELAQSFALSPNPATDVLNINVEAGVTIQSLQVVDVEGRIILTSTSNLSSLNVSALQDGVYLLNIKSNKGNATRKFVKK